MGMAIGPVYPKPAVKKVGWEWRVYWCSMNNQVWYYGFGTWQDAIKFANRGHN